MFQFAKLTPDQDLFLREWIIDLRSGKWKQAYSRLRENNNKDYLCALGVACMTAVRLRLVSKEYLEEFLNRPSRPVAPPEMLIRFFPDNHLDPPALRHSDELEADDDVIRVMELNDSMRWSFLQIADALEKAYLDPNNPPTREPEPIGPLAQGPWKSPD